MTLKTFVALAVAAIIGFAPLSAQAHQGHQHPPAKAKKMKKPKPPQKAGIEKAPAVGPGLSFLRP